MATAVWRFNGSLLTVPPTEQQDYSEYKVDSVSRETSGVYECSISNDVGVATCLFQVSGKTSFLFLEDFHVLKGNKWLTK